MNLERWRRLPYWVRDAGFAVAVTVAELSVLYVAAPTTTALQPAARPTLLEAIVLAATLAPLVLRRRFPQAVLMATVTASIAVVLLSIPAQLLGVLIALYTVAERCARRVSVAWLAGLVVLALALLVRAGALNLVVGQLIVLGTAWLLGDLKRSRTAHQADLERRAAELELDRGRAAQLAVAEERGRIARELHDVVAHSVSVMVVQTGAARRVLRNDPAGARAALDQVVATGSQSLEELRRLLGLLREHDEPAPYEPQPSVSGITDLVERFEQAGLPVRLRVEGSPRPLAPGVELSAYRIVQESLTNALKHAGPASVVVTMDFASDGLHLEVSDDGRGAVPGADRTDGKGHGLLGMRERAAMMGGQLSVGPRPGGGFRVKALLPAEEPR